MSSHHIYCRIFGYVFTIVLHVGNVTYMRYLLQGDVLLDPAIKQYNDLQARYLTCWTFFLQVVYSILGLCCDVLTLRNAGMKDYRLPKHLKGARDHLFGVIQWPSTLLVFSLFWTLFLYDRDLILPATIDQVLTRTSNHIIHTVIVPIVVWEVIFQPRAEPKSHTKNMLHLILYILGYFSVLCYTFYERGVWLYPIFGKFYGTVYFPLFILLIGVALLFYYQIQWYITSMVWGDLRRIKKKT